MFSINRRTQRSSAGKEFPLDKVGNFPPPKRSMFHDLKESGAMESINNDNRSVNGAEDLSLPIIQTATVKTGRIRFEGIEVPPSAPKSLICEECEDRIAVLFCENYKCRQVYCLICADLTHPRVSANDLMHEHEKNKQIRALQFGDKSKIKKKEESWLPDTYVYFEDYQKTHDLSKPNTLSTGSDARRLQKSDLIYKQNCFNVSDMVLFTDPSTGNDAYGRVLSEWDKRHGEIAPAIIRGEHAQVYYVVHLLGQMTDIDDIDKVIQSSGLQILLDEENKDSASSSASRLAETGDAPLRVEYFLASKINKRLRDLNNILLLGPKYHLRDLSEPRNVQNHIVAMHSSVSSETKEKNRLLRVPVVQDKRYIDEETFQRVDLNRYADLEENAQSLIPSHNPHFKPQIAAARSYELYVQSYSSGNPLDSRSAQQQCLDILVLSENALKSLPEYIKSLKIRKEMLLNRLFTRQEMIWMRIQMKAKFVFWRKSLEELKWRKMNFCARKIQSVVRMFFCRDKLEECRQYWADLREQQWKAVHDQFRLAGPNDTKAVTFDQRYYFATHADVNRYARFLNLMLTKIAYFATKKRRLLLKNAIIRWKSAIYDFLESNMQNDHVNLAVVEFDRTIAGNKEFSMMEEKKKMIEVHNLLRIAFSGSGSEASSSGSAEEQAKSIEAEIYNSTSSYRNTSSWPLRMQPPLSYFLESMAKDGDSESSIQSLFEEVVPSYEPERYIELPLLLPVQRPKSLKERLQYDAKFQVRSDEGWAVAVEGPTSESYWLIPQLLMVGEIPFGSAITKEWRQPPDRYHFLQAEEKAAKTASAAQTKPVSQSISHADQVNAQIEQQLALTKKSKSGAGAGSELSAIAALLLLGMNTFVSVLSPDAEAMAERYYKTEPIKDQLANALQTANVMINRVIMENQETIYKQQSKIDKVPIYSKSDPRYPAAYRQILRCKARAAIAETNISRIKKQMKNLPKEVKWLRLPVAHRPFPWTVDDVLPSLWEMERIMKQSPRPFIYLYSGGLSSPEDGPSRHGLCGSIATMLLGKLYHMELADALFRWQKSHDVMRSLLLSPIKYKISCPPLPWQKTLISDVLSKCHKPFEFPTIRTQHDPETFEAAERHKYDESLWNAALPENLAKLHATENKRRSTSGDDTDSDEDASPSEDTERRNGNAAIEPHSLESAWAGEKKIKQSLYFAHEL